MTRVAPHGLSIFVMMNKYRDWVVDVASTFVGKIGIGKVHGGYGKIFPAFALPLYTSILSATYFFMPKITASKNKTQIRRSIFSDINTSCL